MERRRHSLGSGARSGGNGSYFSGWLPICFDSPSHLHPRIDKRNRRVLFRWGCGRFTDPAAQYFPSDSNLAVCPRHCRSNWTHWGGKAGSRIRVRFSVVSTRIALRRMRALHSVRAKLPVLGHSRAFRAAPVCAQSALSVSSSSFLKEITRMKRCSNFNGGCGAGKISRADARPDPVRRSEIPRPSTARCR